MKEMVTINQPYIYIYIYSYIYIAVVLSNRHSFQVTWECHEHCSLQLIEKDLFTHLILFDIGPLEQTVSLIYPWWYL